MTSVTEQQVKRVALYLGSATGDSPAYEEATVRTVRSLAEAGFELVYGGGSVGLMGVAADAALAAGMPVHGVITRHLMDGETGHLGLDTLDIVETMTERKERMASMADAMVTLPGGIGTLEEFFEVWVGQVLGVHHKPVALVDVDGYWQPMVDMLEHMVAKGFFSRDHLDHLIRVDDPALLPAALDLWTPAAAKWS